MARTIQQLFDLTGKTALVCGGQVISDTSIGA